MDDQKEQKQDVCEEEDCKSREFTTTPGQQDQMQDVDEPIKEPIGTSVQQEQTQGAEDQYIQELISSPDKIRRVTKELRKLQFSNPGPQMRSHATDSRLRYRQQQCLPRSSYHHSESDYLVPQKADRCDCLDVECPGCFLPCPKCRSNKCGVVCRVGRSWNYVREVHRDRASDWQEW